MKIAVVGSGISGMTAAWLLSRDHHVELFEADARLGGHTATKQVDFQGKQWTIDTGFIVFNQRTYPNFLKLLDLLDIKSQPTEMGFSVSCKKTGVEYSGSGLSGVFAQKKNIFSAKFLRMLADIIKFNADARALVDQQNLSAGITLGQHIHQQKLSPRFRDHYLLPMAAAIWSSSLDDASNMPLDFFLRFFNNHGLLTVNDHPQWYVIENGSWQYLQAMQKTMDAKIHLSCPISSVQRTPDGLVEIQCKNSKYYFDRVILAGHADQSLSILKDASEAERQLLASVPYRSSDVILHRDTSLLPLNCKAWAAWNYQLSGNPADNAAVTYNMNLLQSLQCDEETDPTFCVTLNQSRAIDPTKILGNYHYSHPGFTLAGVSKRDHYASASGSNKVWFCGAWCGNGFHEDGVVSALKVAKDFAADFPSKAELLKGSQHQPETTTAEEVS